MLIADSGLHLGLWFMAKYVRLRFVFPVSVNHLRNIGIRIVNNTPRDMQYRWEVDSISQRIMGARQGSGAIPSHRGKILLRRSGDEKVSVEVKIIKGKIEIQAEHPYGGVATSKNNDGVRIECELIDGCGKRDITQGSTYRGSAAVIDFTESKT
jgi:hypothetical protein